MREKNAWILNGYLGIFIILVLLAGAVVSFFMEEIVFTVIFLLIAITLASGITLVQPNQSIGVIFLGKSMGSIRKEGIVITVPFSIRRTVSIRDRNFNSNREKVNDIKGNQFEIAADVDYKVVDSAKAVFDVDDYEQFVNIQSETAIRAVATNYPYDSFQDEEEITLRGNAEEVSAQLAREVQDRLKVAGVDVIEARLTHLAYSTEIAQAMLQRQQASAILAARRLIVNGAVGIVEDAIANLEKDGIVKLDEERRAAMINNLLVSIVADNRAQPVINTGSLYQ